MEDINRLKVVLVEKKRTARWENFVVAIGRALESCKSLGINIDNHFREVTKMVPLGKSPSVS